MIGNSGYYVTFETDASNLSERTRSAGTTTTTAQPDVYLYTDTRKITLVQSVATCSPAAARTRSMSFYANYIVFDSPGAIRRRQRAAPGLHALPG